MRRAIELSAKTSLVDKAGGVFGTVIVDKHGHVRQSSVRSFRWLLSSESSLLPLTPLKTRADVLTHQGSTGTCREPPTQMLRRKTKRQNNSAAL